MSSVDLIASRKQWEFVFSWAVIILMLPFTIAIPLWKFAGLSMDVVRVSTYLMSGGVVYFHAHRFIMAYVFIPLENLIGEIENAALVQRRKSEESATTLRNAETTHHRQEQSLQAVISELNGRNDRQEHSLSRAVALLSYQHRRLWREEMAEGYHTDQEWETLKAHYNFTCLRCGQHEPDIKLTRDHVVPLSRGGTDWITNIQPLCGSCNSSKGTKTIDYRQEHVHNG